MNKKELMEKKIIRHGRQLRDIFADATGAPVDLCKKLRRLEIEGEKIALDYANGVIDMNTAHSAGDKILNRLRAILGDFENADVRVFFNYDPRGYALKIEFDPTDVRGQFIYKDWGGYGIIAPDFKEG